MTNRGIDCDTDTTAEVGCIKAAGYSFICRYINRVAKAEIDHIRSQGVYVVSVFEQGANHYGYFSAAQGKMDGIHALGNAQGLGQPLGTPIYFAVDFNASLAEINGEITAYFDAISVQFKRPGLEYHIGVYGSGLTLDTLTAKARVSYGWLSMSGDWRGSQTDKDWNIHQIGGGTLCNINVDYNVSHGNGGGWI